MSLSSLYSCTQLPSAEITGLYDQTQTFSGWFYYFSLFSMFSGLIRCVLVQFPLGLSFEVLFRVAQIYKVSFLSKLGTFQLLFFPSVLLTVLSTCHLAFPSLGFNDVHIWFFRLSSQIFQALLPFLSLCCLDFNFHDYVYDHECASPWVCRLL